MTFLDEISQQYQEDFAQIARIAVQAGERILEVKKNPLQVVEKNDGSPVTIADSAAHKVIFEELSKVSELPFFSEEGEKNWADVQAWEKCWLIDPLDGTRDFIRGTGEYTVNIALIIDRKPVFGAVYLPEKHQLFLGGKGFGSWCNEKPISVCKEERSTIAIESYSHPSPQNQEFYDKHGITDVIRAGSSLKFCKVASGEADLYARFGDTSEWDIAAGLAVVEGAGGFAGQWPGGEELIFQKENRLNPHFIVARNNQFAAQYFES